MEWLLFALLVVGIPFILPIVSFIRLSGLGARLSMLEEVLERQSQEISDLRRRLEAATRAAATTPVAQPVAPPPVVPKPQVVAPAAPLPTPSVPPAQPVQPPVSAARAAPPPPVPPALSPPSVPPTARFDWEQLVGVKMFSAVSGIALVLAAVFFLRYSIDHGWLAPPIRVAIGIVSGIALLVVCDLKAARRYPITANALDAAAIAILFSTFFSAHALWHLVSATVAFGLLALVTATAVLLSIRRDSLFIAVLGLLGGFATPALLSTGENRPLSLFTYLLLLNLGLALVAYRKRWSVLSVLTLVLTAVYQWGWVFRFLSAGQLSIAMGIFIVFAVTGFVALTAGRRTAGDAPWLQHAGVVAATMPLIFAAYLAVVPAYGANALLLFGFLIVIDVGLAAASFATRDDWPHLLGAGTTVVVTAIWLNASYSHGAWFGVLLCVAGLSLLYGAAPIAASALGRPLTALGVRSAYAAPVLLFAFAVVARIEPQRADPIRLFAPMLGLLLFFAWRAANGAEFDRYFIALFFAVAAEAAWSATSLTANRTGVAIASYAALAAIAFGTPAAAARAGRAPQPRWASGAVIVASLPALMYFAAIAPAGATSWGVATVLLVLMLALFVETASAPLPTVTTIAAAIGTVVLGAWWIDAGGAVGARVALLTVTALVSSSLAAQAWTRGRAAPDGAAREWRGFAGGLFLGLLGHVFVACIATNPQWAEPPWPLFGVLAVLTLAAVAWSLATSEGSLAAGAVAASSVAVLAWAHAASASWAWMMVAAAESTSAFGVAWSAMTDDQLLSRSARIGAAVALVVSEFTLVEASSGAGGLPIAVAAAAHAVNLALILALAWRSRWSFVAPAAVIPAWYAAVEWRTSHVARAEWRGSLLLVAVAWLVFVAYPFVLGERARRSRDPFFTAVFGSAFFLFAGHAALLQGGFGGYAGIVPVTAGAVMTLLLRNLLRMEPDADRDAGRLALVAGAALACATVAIPMQLDRQWVTIGWALEGAALAWAYRRIGHPGLGAWSAALLAVVFVRLALNPSILVYEPRGIRIFNWYLYTYLVSAGSMFVAARWFGQGDDRLASALPRPSTLFATCGAVLVFLLLNIEIADYFATGREITFRFGVTLAQDLTYTIGWLAFGLALLTACIYLHVRGGRIAAVVLIAVTACKAFLYDMGSLGGLYRVASLLGLAVSLSLVALALQRFVLRDAEGHA